MKLAVKFQQISNTTDSKMYHYFNEPLMGKRAANMKPCLNNDLG